MLVGLISLAQNREGLLPHPVISARTLENGSTGDAHRVGLLVHGEVGLGRLASDHLLERAIGVAGEDETETDRATSNAALSNGTSSRFPTTNEAPTPSSSARSRATPMSLGAASSPVTTEPERAANNAALPVPVANG